MHMRLILILLSNSLCIYSYYVLTRHEQHPFKVQVQVPKDADKPEWRFNGQVLNIEVAPQDTVTTLKAKLKDAIGIPANKQKLKAAGFAALKDQASMAFYNLT